MMIFRNLPLLLLLAMQQGRGTPRRCCVSAFASPFCSSLTLKQSTRQQHSARTKRHSASHHWFRSIRGGSSSSTSSLSASVEHHHNDNISVEAAAQECIGITGSAMKPSLFANKIPYWDTSAMSEFRVCFVLGGPGAGKGTQSNLLRDNYPCVHLSVGELLRQEQDKDDSPHRQLIEECLVAGRIVPVDISLALLQAAMRREKGKDLLFLVDGFPRNFDNLLGWKRCMEMTASVWGVLLYSCPLRELERRILERAETSGRSDDNLASIQKRFRTFERDTMPVVHALREVEKLQRKKDVPALRIWDVRGNQPLEAVWKDTQCIVNQWILHDVLTANNQLLRAAEQGDASTYLKLCAPELFGDEHGTPEEKLTFVEGKPGAASESGLSNPVVEFVSGTKVIISYDRMFCEESVSKKVRESRVWSHQGERGWVNIHFSRIPL